MNYLFRRILILSIIFTGFFIQNTQAQLKTFSTLTGTEYNTKYHNLKQQGYRLKHVTGYEVGGQARYAAIWTKKNGPQVKSWHKLTRQEYHQKIEQFQNSNFRLKHVSGYNLGNQAFFAVIFVEKNGPDWAENINMTASQYQSTYDNRRSQGYHLVCVSGYAINNQPRYVAVWSKGTNNVVATHHLMNSATYTQKAQVYERQGFKLTHVDAFRVGNADMYAAIWKSGGQKAIAAKHRMNIVNYGSYINNYKYQNFHLVKVCGYNIGGKPHFAAIWKEGKFRQSDISKIDQKINAFKRKYNVMGVQFSVTKNERLVFSKGYGYADFENKIRMNPLHISLIASVSKPITATGIMMLMKRKPNLNLNSRVFGPNSILGNFGSQQLSNKETNIRIKHLLEHTAGGNKWDNNNYKDHLGRGNDENVKTDDPMLRPALKNYTKNQLIRWVLDNRSPNRQPGQYYAYSNFGYCVLGKVFKKLTNRPYASWIKQNVFRPCGITDMHISGNSEANKRPNEMVYYDQTGNNSYNLNLARMDSHGGWVGSTIELLKFAVRVDGRPVKRDIISGTTRTEMLSNHSYVPNPFFKRDSYKKGWGFSNGNMSHGGMLWGVNSRLVIYADGYSYALIVNTHSNHEDFSDDFRALGRSIINEVFRNNSAIPNYDLF